MSKTVLAVGCHPDDIEFMMSGTLFLLKEKGCDLHYLNVANGSCGTQEYNTEEVIKIRAEEGKNAAAYLGATFHDSLVNDLEVFYEDSLIRKVTSVVRKVAPDIILLPSLEDYMEDHMNTARVTVTAAFCRGMINYYSIPAQPIVTKDVYLYHALPYGLHDGMNKKIIPKFLANIESTIKNRETMLAHHKSQKEWLDKSQGLDAYLKTMTEMSKDVAADSSDVEFAEGWRPHSHLGYSAQPGNPMKELLGDQLVEVK